MFIHEYGSKEDPGASLGVAIGYRIFPDPDFAVHHAWFGGVALQRNARFPEWFMKKMFRNRKKKLAKTKVEASPSLVQMYGYDFAKMMMKNFERITESDIDAICHACCHYDLRKLTDEPDDTVLECACGTGLLSAVIAPKCRWLTATDFWRNSHELYT